MNFLGVTPQVEDLTKQFPGWPTVLVTAAVYLGVAVVLYFFAKFLVVRLIRRQRRKQEAALTLPPGPAHDRAVENGRKRLEKVQQAILRVVKLVITMICFVFAIGDLFPTLDMLSGTMSILILGGTALGLAGALQPYIRDVIGGSLLFFEDAYSVGDWVKIAGVEGTVEELHIRRTVVRASDGAVHVVPNGAVGIATNMSRVWATTTVEIVLAHDVDLDKAIAVADATAATLAEDDHWNYRIIETPRVSRVSDVSPDGVTIRLTGKVATGEAGVVAGELRRRLHHAYHEAEIPLARRDTLLGPVLAAARPHGQAQHPGGKAPAKATGGTAAMSHTPATVAAADDAAATPLGADRRGAGADPRTPTGRR